MIYFSSNVASVPRSAEHAGSNSNTSVFNAALVSLSHLWPEEEEIRKGSAEDERDGQEKKTTLKWVYTLRSTQTPAVFSTLHHGWWRQQSTKWKKCNNGIKARCYNNVIRCYFCNNIILFPILGTTFSNNDVASHCSSQCGGSTRAPQRWPSSVCGEAHRGKSRGLCDLTHKGRSPGVSNPVNIKLSEASAVDKAPNWGNRRGHRNGMEKSLWCKTWDESSQGNREEPF